MKKINEQNTEQDNKDSMKKLMEEINKINTTKNGIDASTIYQNLMDLFAQYSTKIDLEEFRGLLATVNDELVKISDKRIDEKPLDKKLKEDDLSLGYENGFYAILDNQDHKQQNPLGSILEYLKKNRPDLFNILKEKLGEATMDDNKIDKNFFTNIFENLMKNGEEKDVMGEWTKRILLVENQNNEKNGNQMGR